MVRTLFLIIAVVVIARWIDRNRDREDRARELMEASAPAREAGAQADAAGAPEGVSAGAGATPIEIPLDDLAGDREASLARNVYVVFDGSGSMRGRPNRDCGGDQRFESKLEGAQWALERFLEQVPADVNLGLYVFDREGQREVVALPGDRGAFLDAVAAIRSGGRTPLAAAIRFATDRLVERYRHQLGYGEYRLVVITDGKASGIPEAAAYASRYGMPIYAIGLCLREEHELRRLAVSYRAADNFADLARGLEETLAELPSYDPTAFEPGLEDVP